MTEIVNSPVIIRSIGNTSNEEIKHLVFEQRFEKPLNDLSSLASFSLSGCSKFGESHIGIRTTFWNFSLEQIEALELQEGKPFPERFLPKIVIHEFCKGDSIPESLRGYYENRGIFIPKKYKKKEGTLGEKMVIQEPKMTPKGRDIQYVLVKNGKPIYRLTHLALGNMEKEDFFLRHDGYITIEEYDDMVKEPESLEEIDI